MNGYVACEAADSREAQMRTAKRLVIVVAAAAAALLAWQAAASAASMVEYALLL